MDDSNAVELYRRLRPKMFKEMVGQPEAVKVLKDMVDNNRVPHALMLTGGSGVGKTTFARIIKSKLKCGDMDFTEMNVADVRGVDSVRDIRNQTGLSPMQGNCRMWLLDEIHRATVDAQSALLKILEDVPPHVYFILCTTDPNKLLPAIRTRCTCIALKPIPRADLTALVVSVCAKEKIEPKPSTEVIAKIAEAAEGSARKALVLLGQVMGLKTEQEQLAAIAPEKAKEDAFNIVRALLWKKTTWSDMLKVINAVGDEQEWEGLRHLALANAAKEMLKENGNHARAAVVIEAFERNWFDGKKASLLRACWEVLGTG